MTKAIRALTLALIVTCPVSAAQSAPQKSDFSKIRTDQAQAPQNPTPVLKGTRSFSVPPKKITAQRADEDKKRFLTPSSYDRWNTIEEPVLSSDGNWVAYTLVSPLGAAELVVRAAHGSTEFRVSRGTADRPSTPSLSFGRVRAPVQITADSHFAVFTITAAISNEMGVGATPPDVGTSALSTLGILSLSNGQLSRIPQVSSFAIPKTSGDHIAYKTGDALVLHNLKTGIQVRIRAVTDFAFDAQGRYLAYATVRSSLPEGEAVYVRRIVDGRIVVLWEQPGRHRGMTFDESGEQLAFYCEEASNERTPARYSICLSRSPMRAGERVVASSDVGKPWRVSLLTRLAFTRSGNALMFGLVPESTEREPVEPVSTKATFDLWHWNDPLPQWAQKSAAVRASSHISLAAYYVGARRWVTLDDKAFVRMLVTPDARYAIGIDERPYLPRTVWNEQPADLYFIDGLSGQSRLVKRGLLWGKRPGVVSLSPNGRYLMYFRDRRWFGYDLEAEKETDLTGGLLPEVRFEHENTYADTDPRPPIPIGIAGWTKQGRRAFIYDQRDVWEVDPSGKSAPRNVTHGIGRTKNVLFRVWPHVVTEAMTYTELDDEIDSRGPLLLTGLDDDSMASSFWRLGFGRDASMKLMLRANKKIVLHERRSERYLATQETFEEFPDVWVGQTFSELLRISNANPQQREYAWGVADLVAWQSDSGGGLKGVLYKPESFNAKKKYPMIVSAGFLPGQASRLLHDHAVPRLPTNGVIAYGLVSTYVSKGYLVFLPDAAYIKPYFGESALASVVSGVRSVVERGFVDTSRLALTGHSHGGGMTNYIITHSNLFKCAIESAGSANQISVYGAGIPHIGAVRAGTQERLHGGSIWELPHAYLLNSPLMFAHRVQTPLLMMHNDADDSVSFSQAMEWYLALRRNGKQVYLFNYNREPHDLTKYENQLDWAQRMEQFLDHCLMDASEPHWMKHGIPYKDKGLMYGFEPP